ncbi:radical SAM protein [Sphaerospermopsis torques-reginae]|uniref:Radical SAM protein n=1 Tax=Sphaerospermopsis torques-reginae ITEP-024 TaxID=984208 RepID=A0ABX8X245_9CYAN|nr:radical SAM protein [Sphaerospermopsis torques-reginae]QYX32777.1 radical SAM protein [Sphaerospermopsis torques-reginae ITEP-024]
MNLIMKLSKLCNLRCTYCYEYDELANKERMSLDGIEFFFKNMADYMIKEEKNFSLTLIFHGGEALLLPHNYLRSICELKDKYLTKNGINTRTTVQSNLFKISSKTLDLLEELEIQLGFSLDVFGEQRLDIAGKVSQDQVLDNLQLLLDRQIPVGGISVLHALNVDKALQTYQFYNELGIDYRILPIHSSREILPERMSNLLLSHQQTINALKMIAKAQFSEISHITVQPLNEYFQAAVRYIINSTIDIYNPYIHDWAWIVNTNGDVYAHGDAYLAEGLMGNIFQQTVSEIFQSQDFVNVTNHRMKRGELCRRCQYDRKCNQIAITEAIPSERVYDSCGILQCAIAKPMIEFMIDEIRNSPDSQSIFEVYK